MLIFYCSSNFVASVAGLANTYTLSMAGQPIGVPGEIVRGAREGGKEGKHYHNWPGIHNLGRWREWSASGLESTPAVLASPAAPHHRTGRR